MSESSDKRWRRWVGIASVMMVMVTALTVRGDDGSPIDLKIERVALFKNGLGYFMSSGTLPKGATTVTLGKLPVASQGTFWVGYPKDVAVRSLFTRMENVEEPAAARSVTELLEANVGRKVAIRVGSGDAPAIRGTIAAVMSGPKPPEPQSVYVMGVQRFRRPGEHVGNAAPALVIIATDRGTVTLDAGTIMRADFEGSGIATSVPSTSERPSIRMELERPATGSEIEVSYLTRGITWSPSYLIDISGPKTARLSAKAIVINEVADLHDVQLALVTGFLNIQFGHVNSPVSMSQNIEGFLTALTASRREPPGRGFMMRQQASLAVGAQRRGEGGAAAVPLVGYSTAREGSVSEDLFLYPVEHLTLSRKETAYIPLFTAEVSYKHVYVWKIRDLIDEYRRWRNGYERGKDEPQLAEEVWHSCRLVNDMKMPWTTAAAEFVKNGQVVGQDICYYTAPGAETTIRVNRAMNILAEQAEVELERKRNAAHFYGEDWDLVKVKGELKLRSRMDKNVHMEVTKNLSGEVREIVPQAKDTRTAKGLKWANPRHVLLWEIDLEPGDKRTLSYTYEVYVLRR